MKTFERKGQEEIVGFVAIALLVTVVAVVFLVISANKESGVQKESKDISRFLESSMIYTTDCALGYEPNYLTPKDLLKECYSNKGKKCLDDKEVCSALNETMLLILDRSWTVGPEAKTKGYSFKSVYSKNSSKMDGEEILILGKGNCSSGVYIGGDSFFSVYPGTITSSLRLCY